MKRTIHRVDKRKIDKRFWPKCWRMQTTWRYKGLRKQKGNAKSLSFSLSPLSVSLSLGAARCLSLLTIVSETLTECATTMGAEAGEDSDSYKPERAGRERERARKRESERQPARSNGCFNDIQSVKSSGRLARQIPPTPTQSHSCCCQIAASASASAGRTS